MNIKKLLLSAILVLTFVVSTTAFAMNGDGTEESPFLITTQDELKAIDSFPDCHFSLLNDIVLEGTWMPVCSNSDFTGVFDGNGHTVSNMTISSDRTYLGFFGKNSGIVKNLKIVTSESGIKFTGANYIGGIAGYNYADGVIDSCSFNGNLSGGVRSNRPRIGGIAGQNCGIISKCCTVGSLKEQDSNNDISLSYVGGICGDYDSSARVFDCYSRMAVLGGIESGIGGNATNCYYAGTSAIFFVVGSAATNCFYDTAITGMSSTAYGTPKTTTDMQVKKTYLDAGWDFENTWGIDPDINDGYPYLLWEYEDDMALGVDIISVKSGADSVKFISEAQIEGEPEIEAFGTAFIPLWLFGTGSSDTATVEYQNSDYDIKSGQTFGATLSGIPQDCFGMDIVAKSYIKNADGSYTWSDAKYSSVNNPVLKSVE